MRIQEQLAKLWAKYMSPQMGIQVKDKQKAEKMSKELLKILRTKNANKEQAAEDKLNEMLAGNKREKERHF